MTCDVLRFGNAIILTTPYFIYLPFAAGIFTAAHRTESQVAAWLWKNWLINKIHLKYADTDSRTSSGKRKIDVMVHLDNLSANY